MAKRPKREASEAANERLSGPLNIMVVAPDGTRMQNGKPVSEREQAISEAWEIWHDTGDMKALSDLGIVD